MKTRKIQGFFVFSILFCAMPFSFGMDFSFDFGQENVDLYSEIGMSKEEYKQKFDSAITKDKTVDDLKELAEKYEKAIAAQEKLREDTSDSVRQSMISNKIFMLQSERGSLLRNIKKELLKSFYKNVEIQKKISDGCKKTRSELLKEQKKIEVELQNSGLSNYERRKREKHLAEIKRMQKKLVSACPILLDPKTRADYDIQLFLQKRESFSRDPFFAVQEAVEKASRFTPGRRVMLNDLIGYVLAEKINFSGPVASIFNKNLELSDVRFLKRPSGYEVRYGLGFEASVRVLGAKTTMSFVLIQDIFGARQFAIKVALPVDFKLSQLFPKFTGLDWLPIPSPILSYSSFDAQLESGMIPKGVSIGAEWKLFQGPFAFMNKFLEEYITKGAVLEANPIKVTIFIDPRNILQTKAQLTVPMKIGMDFQKISKVPKWFSRAINKVNTTYFSINIEPAKAVVDLDKRLEEKKAELQKEIERHQKITEEKDKDVLSFDSTLKEDIELDLKRSQSKVIALQKEVKGIEAEKIAKKRREERIQKAKEGKFDISEYGKTTYLQNKNQDLSRQALELAKKGPQVIDQKERIEELEKEVQELEERELKREVELREKETAWRERLGQLIKFGIAGFKITASGGAEFYLGGADIPLKTDLQGVIIPVSARHPQGFISLFAALNNMIEFGWLSIGNIVIAFDWDMAMLQIMLALGVPVTGIGIKGKIALGKPGVARASLDALGGISLVSSGIPDFLFEVTASNIRLTDMINYSLYLATKTGLGSAGKLINKIPTINFEKISGYASAGKATILGRSIEPGIGAEINTILFGYPFGGQLNIGGTDKGYKMTGYAYGPRLEWKNRLALFGDNEKESPRISFDFDPANLSKIEFDLAGTIIVPPLSLQARTKFKWARNTIEANFTSKWANLNVSYGISMNPNAGRIKGSDYEFQKRAVEMKLEQKEGPVLRAAQFALQNDVRKLEQKDNFEDAYIFLDVIEHRLAKAKDFESESLLEKLEKNIGLQEEPKSKEKKEIEMIKAYLELSLEAWEIVAQKALERIRVQAKKDSKNKIKFESLESELERIDKQIGEKEIQTDLLKNLKKVYKGIMALSEQLNISTDERSNNLTKRKVKSVDQSAKWRGLNIYFGFSGELSKFLSERAIPYLKQKKESLLKSLDRFTDELGRKTVAVTEADLKASRERIAQTEQEIKKLKEECAKKSYLKQPACRAKILTKQTMLQSRKKIYNTYLQTKRVVVKKSSQMARAALRSRFIRGTLEKFLEITTVALEKALSGLTIVEVSEARGSYSYQDLKALKLPRLDSLKVKENITGKGISLSLHNLQFDFKSPLKTGTEIFAQVYGGIVSSVKKAAAKTAKEMARKMAEEVGGSSIPTDEEINEIPIPAGTAERSTQTQINKK